MQGEERRIEPVHVHVLHARARTPSSSLRDESSRSLSDSSASLCFFVLARLVLCKSKGGGDQKTNMLPPKQSLPQNARAVLERV